MFVVSRDKNRSRESRSCVGEHKGGPGDQARVFQVLMMRVCQESFVEDEVEIVSRVR